MEFGFELLVGIVVVFVILLLSSLKQINQYERGVKFTKGKFSGIMEPGWHVVWPIFQSFKKVDIRTKVVDVPEQEAITKDNVSVKINAVLYYKVFNASLAVLEVENFYYATAQLAQTTMRNIVGSVTLDELLTEREKQAVITKAKGEAEAAKNLSDAASMLAQAPGALHLRTLETINDVSSDQSNTIFFAMPIEMLEAIKGFADYTGKKLKDKKED